MVQKNEGSIACLEAGEKIMAKVEYNELVNSVSGKLCKEDGSPIFARRRDTGTKYVYHRHAKPDKEPTPGQLAQQQKFATAGAEVKTIMSSLEQIAPYRESFAKQTKYKTLRGYIFAEVYKNA